MKNRTIRITHTCLLISALWLAACSSDDDRGPALIPTGSVEVSILHKWNTQAFEVYETYIHPLSGEEITFQELKYYLSNVRLHRSDGTAWSEPESYHLIDARLVGNGFTLSGIPAGDYVAISYLIGVDSTRNVSGAQSGALDPANNMFWSWNTGYIFIKAEGASSLSPQGEFSYHIGGFRVPDVAVVSAEHPLSAAQGGVAEGNPVQLEIQCDVAALWDESNSTAEVPYVHSPGLAAVKLSHRFAGGFTLLP